MATSWHLASNMQNRQLTIVSSIIVPLPCSIITELVAVCTGVGSESKEKEKELANYAQV